MKRILSIILVIGILFSLNTINAETNNNSCENCTEIAQIGEDYVDPDWLSVANGDNIPAPRATSHLLTITKYYQTDYNNIMQTCNKTIASAGCALTSVTMTNNYLNFQEKTPAEVNTILGNYACPMSWSNAGSRLGITLRLNKTSGLTTSYVQSEIVSQINQGVPVIVGLDLWTGITHYVLVRGYVQSSGTYTFWINDPSRNYNYSYLSDYTSRGASIIQLVVYSD